MKWLWGITSKRQYIQKHNTINNRHIKPSKVYKNSHTSKEKKLNHHVSSYIILLFKRYYRNWSHYYYHFTVWRETGVLETLVSFHAHRPTCCATYLKQTCLPPVPRWLSRRWSVLGNTTGSGCRRGLWTFVVSAPSFLRFRPAFPFSSYAWLGFTSFSLAAAPGNTVCAPESLFFTYV